MGTTKFTLWEMNQKGTSGASARRGGAQVDVKGRLLPPTSGHYLHALYNKVERKGEDCLFDDLRLSGNTASRLTPDEERLVRDVINIDLDDEEMTYSRIIADVKAMFHKHNMDLDPKNPTMRAYKIPGAYVIRRMIEDIAPIDHRIRTRGKGAAYASMHAVGMVVPTTRSLERVEIDEYTMDSMTLLRETGVMEVLPEYYRAMLKEHGATQRLVVSAAIDAHTRCILGMKIGLSASPALFAQTLEMVCSPKDRMFDGVVTLDWPMHGLPESIVLDRGSAYVADSSYDLMQALGIVNKGAVAKMPWLRGKGERFFRTLHMGIVQRFTGRTFGSVAARGSRQPEEQATMLLEEVLEWLVRWIVDIYHTTPHTGLNGRRPYEVWQEAVKTMPPRGVSRSLMRKSFGVKLERKLSPKGLVVHDVYYTSPELYEAYATRLGEQKVELRYWPTDIGVIDVKLANGEWLSVPATDPQ